MNKETEIILSLKEWHGHVVEQLRNVTDANEGINFKAMNNEGESVDIPKELIPGIKVGISIALDVLGPFPVTITKKHT